jgi:hypothetical protein
MEEPSVSISPNQEPHAAVGLVEDAVEVAVDVAAAVVNALRFRKDNVAVVILVAFLTVTLLEELVAAAADSVEAVVAATVEEEVDTAVAEDAEEVDTAATPEFN